MEEKESNDEDEIEIIEIEDEEADSQMPLLDTQLAELNDRYLRLYADFENYKKRVQKDREELVKYGNESLLYELLIVFDNLEMALKHSTNNVSDSIVKGVEITLRELQRVTEKFGLKPIEAINKSFDPSKHHAMTQVERDDVDDKTVVEEFRKGYMLDEKVLRPTLVAVSKKTQIKREEDSEEIKIETEEE